MWVFFFKCWRILQSSAQPHESATRPLQKAAGHIKGTCPPCSFQFKQANEFPSRQYCHSTTIIAKSARFVVQGCPTSVQIFKKSDLKALKQYHYCHKKIGWCGKYVSNCSGQKVEPRPLNSPVPPWNSWFKLCSHGLTVEASFFMVYSPWPQQTCLVTWMEALVHSRNAEMSPFGI